MNESGQSQFSPKAPEEQKDNFLVRRPAIRTMKTDVSEFMKSEKPSLITLISQNSDAREQEPKPSIKSFFQRIDWKVVGMIAGGVIALLAVLFAVITFFKTQTPVSPEGGGKPPAPIRTSYLSYDATRNISAKNQSEFAARIAELTNAERSAGQLQKLAVTVTGGTAKPHQMGLKEFMYFVSTVAPKGFENAALSFVEPFIYNADTNAVFGAVIPVKSSDAALQALAVWEPSLPRDLNFFLLGKRPESSILLFEDRNYKNFQYRFVRLSQGADFGIGYVVFRPKNYVIITTSEEALRVVISRLLES